MVIQEAFTKSKALPDFGGIGQDNAIKLRNYIWKICGFLSDEEKASIASSGSQSKKNALIVLYRLWSALTKKIRYNIEAKGKASKIPNFGTFMLDSSDSSAVSFVESKELAKNLDVVKPTVDVNISQSPEPEWHLIA